MNQTDLISRIQEEAGLTKQQATAALQSFQTAVIESLANKGEVSMKGFGTFSTTIRPAREGRNPKTGEPVQIAESVAVKFKVGSAFKKAVN